MKKISKSLYIIDCKTPHYKLCIHKHFHSFFSCLNSKEVFRMKKKYLQKIEDLCRFCELNASVHETRHRVMIYSQSRHRTHSFSDFTKKNCSFNVLSSCFPKVLLDFQLQFEPHVNRGSHHYHFKI